MLGARIVYDLLQAGYGIRAIYRNRKRIDQFIQNVSYYGNNAKDWSAEVEWVEADILDYPAICSAVEGVNYVIHSAAMVSFHSADQATMLDINVHGTENIVNACILNNISRLYHVSSIAAIGKEDEGVAISEKTNWVPEQKHSGYQISKFFSEMEVWRGINEGLEAVIVNPSVILGPGEWHAGSPAFYNNIAKGMKFYPTGGTGFVDVRDVSHIIFQMLEDENWEIVMGKRYLLNAENLPYKQAFEQIAQSLGVKAPSLPANKYLLAIAWRAAWLAGKLSGKKPLITRGSVSNASKKQLFDGSKICNDIGVTYRDLATSIAEIGEMYLQDHKK